MNRKRSAHVTLGALLAAAALTGCGDTNPPPAAEQPPQYEAVCVDPDTGLTVDDDRCDDEHTHYRWFFVPYGLKPRTGEHVDLSKGSFARPAGRVAPRGGFGGHGTTSGS